MEQLILNPLTKRYVKFGSANHKRFVANGTLSPPEVMPAPKAREKLSEQTQQQKMDTEIIKQSVSGVEKNIENSLKVCPKKNQMTSSQNYFMID